mmetsp:Transcript_11019/g.32882  ORF Transcript_11019/g.32882 Transcript_11019/m.32882 type:complete len:351 (-) Transcript_11019:23-1075(-)
MARALISFMLLQSAASLQLRANRRLRGAAPRAAAAEPGFDLSLFSPAKVNLFLRIIEKRPDGFHELASLFQAITLGDYLHFEQLDGASKDVLECDVPGCPLDDTNLVLRAIALLREKVDADIPYFRVRLDKRTPIQAGLGGGSSNAAAALYGANELAGRPATAAELIDWSGALGSDITFFLGPTGSAYCTGRGELLEPVEALPPLGASGARLFVVKPSTGLSTPLVFKTLAAADYTTLRRDRAPRDLLEAFAAPGLTGPEDYVNDLEPPAFTCEPVLADLKTKLLDYGFHAAMMSGSGTSLFAVASGREEGLETFPETFTKDAKDSLGVDVTVWPCDFLPRDADGWYPSL